MSEDQFQAMLWQWSWNELPETRGILYAVPNGGWRDVATAKKLQATGVIPGVWDLHFYWRRQLYCFELKVGNNGLSMAQKTWRDRMALQGAICILISEADGGESMFKHRLMQIVGRTDPHATRSA